MSLAQSQTEARAMGLRGSEQRTARFFFFNGGGEVIKIKLVLGQVARHHEYQITDEGWDRISRSWHFDGETVLLEWYRDGRDCDGRHESFGEARCAFEQLQAGYKPPDHIGVRCPVWIDGQHGQRDHAAEAMGY